MLRNMPERESQRRSSQLRVLVVVSRMEDPPPLPQGNLVLHPIRWT